MPRTPKQQRWQIAYGKRRRRAFVAAGLRTDGKRRIGRKPCGCLSGSCLKCRRRDNKGYWSDAQVGAMKKDYYSGMSRAAVERKHGVGHKGLQNIFQRRGFSLRPPTHMPKRDPRTGRICPHIPKTPQQIEAMVAALTQLRIPDDLKHEWRLWSLEKRAGFIKRLREKFPSTRPTGKFSSNVTPFEYGTPAAHALADKLNSGRTSQTKVSAMKPGSEGVIYKGNLYFWCSGDTYVRGCGWRAETGRPILKRVIWEEANGCPAPCATMVTQKDGNLNNFSPANLALISRGENALRNSVPERLKKDPKNPVLLAKLKLRGDRAWATRTQRNARKARSATAALLQNFQGPQKNSVFDALTRRNS